MTYQSPSAAEWRALKTSAGVSSAVDRSADAALEHARSIAPVRSGEYRDAFRVESGVTENRAVAFLVNDAEYAAQVEWAQQRHVLSQTADFLEGGA